MRILIEKTVARGYGCGPNKTIRKQQYIRQVNGRTSARLSGREVDLFLGRLWRGYGEGISLLDPVIIARLQEISCVNSNWPMAGEPFLVMVIRPPSSCSAWSLRSYILPARISAGLGKPT